MVKRRKNDDKIKSLETQSSAVERDVREGKAENSRVPHERRKAAAPRDWRVWE